tara:strand:- start:55 stop:249 length:195 start_codon:yes stop_codon:yes gene_type:complete
MSKKTEKSKNYKAEKGFKDSISNPNPHLNKKQMEKLLKGESDSLNNLPDKFFNYLLSNKLIKEV